MPNSNKTVNISKTSYAPNKYLMLLKRLDEEEGLSDPSMEEKLKLAEDRLRLTCVKFCEDSSALLEEETERADIFEAENIQELFEVQCFKPSLRPPKSELRTLRSGMTLKPTNYELQEDHLARRKMQQAFYLPPSSWFSSEKAGSDLSSEEVELLSSCATKAFVKFLEGKKMEIPKIFSRIAEKIPEERSV